MNWGLNNVPGMCSPDQPNHFTCPLATVFFNASIIWGVRVHSSIIDLYRSLAHNVSLQLAWFTQILYGFSLWELYFLYPCSFGWENIHNIGYDIFIFLLSLEAWEWFLLLPLWITSLGQLSSISSFQIYLIFSFIFNFLIKRRWLGWWTKYNYILVSSTFDSF